MYIAPRRTVETRKRHEQDVVETADAHREMGTILLSVLEICSNSLSIGLTGTAPVEVSPSIGVNKPGGRNFRVLL
eukprot:scaffold9289_cov101-Cylindrotheca_fusiformis.AAC.4